MEIDLRGLSCPIPVLKAKKALEASDQRVLFFLVDRGAPVANISRLAAKEGCIVEPEEIDDGVKLKIIRS